MLGEDGRLHPDVLAWMRVEDRLGGPGQMVSYAAAWSPDESRPRGFAWPADLETGAVIEEVYGRWRARSPAADLATPEGHARARRLSGNLAITVGRADEFRLFPPAESYMRQLREAGIEVRWLPTALGHFGESEARFEPLAQFLMERLGGE